jgi:thioredoxin reductase
VEVVIMTDERSTLHPKNLTGAHLSDPGAPIRPVDVAVIGGGAAGLNAALVLARSRRSVLVIDAGAPRNAPAAGVHGFLTRGGVSPTELLALGRAEVERYGGTIWHGEARAARKAADGFEIDLEDGRQVRARRLIVTTGLTDDLPDVAGLRERWGRDVLHCPYCHGWEAQDRPIGILATGPMAVHQALLFRQWTDDLVLFAHTAPPFSDEQMEQFAALGIRVVAGRVASLEVADDRLIGVVMEDGTRVAREALVVAPRFVANSGVLRGLGIEPARHPLGGEYVAADAMGKTTVPGVWVAGNVADLKAQVVAAAAGGANVATAVNADLVEEDTRRAVAAYRARRLSKTA